MFVNDLFGSTNEDQQRLDPKCWTGYRKAGTKMKGGVRVNNCVPANEESADAGITKDAETKFHAKLDRLVHDTFGKRDDEMPAKEGRDWDEGNSEPANNFAITINGRHWKVFQGHGYYADDEREMKQYYKLKDWCRKKSEQTGKQWEVYRTGAPATESVSEGQLELNTPDPVVVVQDLKGNILDKVNLSVAAQKYKLGNPQDIKKQLAHQNYTTIGNYVVVSPMTGQPQDATTQGVAEGSAGAKYKIKSIGKDKNGDYYISPNTGKKVYKQAKVGDHETPRGEVKPNVAEGSLEEVSLDLAKRTRDKSEHMVDMDYDDMRDRPYGYSEKQRSKFQRYIDRKEPRAKGDRDWDPPKQGVAEEKKGLYYYVNKRKKAGTSRPASHPKAPTAQAWKDAAKTAKKESVSESYDLQVRLMEMRLAGYQV